jgi:hypothetical protein
MAINIDKVGEQVFKILKGHGLVLELFTSDGKSTVDPMEAKRFYNAENKMMINLDVSEEKTELKIGLGKSTDVDGLRKLFNNLRNLANRNIIEYTLRTFGKDIEPRDFAFQAKKDSEMNVQESFSKPYGSSKSSYQALENARLIIKHKKHVDEEVRGSRSRNIHSLFIENADGERYKFPGTNLSAARAMLRHVKEGGVPHDDMGTHIVALSEEFAELTKFRNYAKKSSLISEDTQNVLEGVSNRLEGIRKQFKSLSGTKGYKRYSEGYEGNQETVSLEEEGLDSLRDQFTVRTFDENVASALPHVARVVREISDTKGRAHRLTALVTKVTGGDDLTLSKPIDASDPDHPENLQFRQELERQAAFSGYLSKHVRDDELGNMLMQLGMDMHDMDPKQVSVANKVLTYLTRSVNMDNPKEASVDATEDVYKQIDESFSKYNPEDFLI